MYNVLLSVQVLQYIMTQAYVHLKRSVVVKGLFDPQILSTLRIKGQGLHRASAHLKFEVGHQILPRATPVSYTHLTLPTNREV